MATRAKKKPVKRKARGASALNRSLSLFGWLASAGVAGAWAVSDGRPAHFASDALDYARRTTGVASLDDRVAALIRAERADGSDGRPASSALNRSAVSMHERTGSVHPVPKPAVVPKKEETSQVERRVPLPASAPLPPLSAPPLEYAIRQPKPLPLASFAVPVGEERHATRGLAAHAAPDAASAKLASVESGSSVVVLRSAGEWRYVRNGRSGVEGWVDGRFLAGEAMSADLATLAQQDLGRR